jgi:hypothetical protein
MLLGCCNSFQSAILMRLLLLALIILFVIADLHTFSPAPKLTNQVYLAQHDIASRRSQLAGLVARWKQQHRSLKSLQKILRCVPAAVRMQQLRFSASGFSLMWQDVSKNKDLNIACWNKLHVNIASVEHGADGTLTIVGAWHAHT